MTTPRDLQGILAQLQASPRWKEAEESGSGQSLADLIIASYEKRKTEEQQAGLLEISLGTACYRYPVKDMDRVGAYIAQHEQLPQEWRVKESWEDD